MDNKTPAKLKPTVLATHMDTDTQLSTYREATLAPRQQAPETHSYQLIHASQPSPSIALTY